MKSAAEKVGYSPSTVNNAGVAVFKTPGVRAYLNKLDQESRKKFGLSIQDKVMNTFFEALDANKLHGVKRFKEYPDHPTRIVAADRFTRFLGWEDAGIQDESKRFNQFNFFNVDPNKQKQFHSNLKNMIRKAYA